MANLLPEPEKARLKREYLLRVATMTLVVLAVVTTIGAILLLPSYFLTESRSVVVKQQVEVVTQAIETRSSQENTDQILKDTREKLLAVKEDPQQFAPVIARVVEVIPSDISVRSFFITTNEDTPTLTIKGVAENRDVLVDLQETLRQFDILSDVSLPVSNLASSQDISFSMKMTILTP